MVVVVVEVVTYVCNCPYNVYCTVLSCQSMLNLGRKKRIVYLGIFCFTRVYKKATSINQSNHPQEEEEEEEEAPSRSSSHNEFARPPSVQG